MRKSVTNFHSGVWSVVRHGKNVNKVYKKTVSNVERLSIIDRDTAPRSMHLLDENEIRSADGNRQRNKLTRIRSCKRFEIRVNPTGVRLLLNVLPNKSGLAVKKTFPSRIQCNVYYVRFEIKPSGTNANV